MGLENFNVLIRDKKGIPFKTIDYPQFGTTVRKAKSIRIEDILKLNPTIIDTNVTYYQPDEFENIMHSLSKCKRAQSLPLDHINNYIIYLENLLNTFAIHNVIFVDGVNNEINDAFNSIKDHYKRINKVYNREYWDSDKESKLNLEILLKLKTQMSKLVALVHQRDIVNQLDNAQMKIFMDVFDFLIKYSDKIKKPLKRKRNGKLKIDYRADENIVAGAIAYAFKRKVNIISNDKDVTGLLKFYYEEYKKREEVDLKLPNLSINVFAESGLEDEVYRLIRIF